MTDIELRWRRLAEACEQGIKLQHNSARVPKRWQVVLMNLPDDPSEQADTDYCELYAATLDDALTAAEQYATEKWGYKRDD